MPELDEDAVARILVVVAHPDDCDFGCAGSTARWTAEGRTVSYCLVTDGEAGGSDRRQTRQEMARIRRQEQTAAAEVVGVHDLHFLGHPDGALYPTIEVRRDITRVIRQVRPQRVVCQTPERNHGRVYGSHPDHLAAGEATLCAVYPDSRNPFAHMELLEQEGLEPFTVPEVYMMTANLADTIIDVTDTMDLKIDALRCHRSQYSDFAGLEERVRSWAHVNAEQHGLGEGRSAEVFIRMPTG